MSIPSYKNRHYSNKQGLGIIYISSATFFNFFNMTQRLLVNTTARLTGHSESIVNTVCWPAHHLLTHGMYCPGLSPQSQPKFLFWLKYVDGNIWYKIYKTAITVPVGRQSTWSHKHAKRQFLVKIVNDGNMSQPKLVMGLKGNLS